MIEHDSYQHVKTLSDNLEDYQSLVLAKSRKPGTARVLMREYYTYDRPDYRFVCYVNPDTARALITDKIVAVGSYDPPLYFKTRRNKNA